MELNYKLEIEAKPEIIYSALVTDSGVKSWLCQQASVGKGEGDTHYLVFQKEGNLRAVNFRIIKLISNEKVIWSCLYSDNPIWPGSVITFDIGNDGVLELTHQGFKDDSTGTELFEALKGVWKYFLNNVKDF